MQNARPSRVGTSKRMITRMSETIDEEHQRPVAPGIARAMRDVRNAGALTASAHRRRWSLPSDRATDPEATER